MSIIIEHPGAHTTIQDLGRIGFRSAGVPVGGAIDPLALRVANWLVGNDDTAAAIECLLVGPRMRFKRDLLVAVCGAKPAGLPHWQAFEVRAGERLSLADLSRGSAAYLSVAGGIDVPAILGSRSTDTRLGWGGLSGRALRAGDVLQLAAPSKATVSGNWRANFDVWYPRNAPLRVVRGEHWGQFDSHWHHRTFTTTAKSNRMGIRLQGEPLARNNDNELPSSPVSPGTIQVPPDGQPILLLADAQTLGGYPRLAHVISADLPRAAQLRPGESVRFEEISLSQAHQLLQQQTRDLAMLRQGIAGKLSP